MQSKSLQRGTSAVPFNAFSKSHDTDLSAVSIVSRDVRDSFKFAFQPTDNASFI